MPEEQNKNDNALEPTKRDLDFKPNNYTANYTAIQPLEDAKPKEEKPKRKIKGKEKEKGFFERIADNFLNIDYDRIKDRLLYDWLFPEVVATIGDILRMALSKDGNPIRRRRDSKSNGGGKIPYSSISDEKSKERDRDNPVRQNFRKIKLVFYTREDAESIIDDLRESLQESNVGCVTVRELYSLADMPTNYSMNSWGWYDLEDAIIERDGDDYILEMPKAEPISSR